MLKYLIVQLDDTSVSFCHYPNSRKEKHLIASSDLEKAVLWAMKENLTIQYLYPDYILPYEYRQIINRTFHADIVSDKSDDSKLSENADVVVFESWNDLNHYDLNDEKAYVIRTTLTDFLTNRDLLDVVLPRFNRLNVVITDVERFNKESKYSEFLDKISSSLVKEYKNGHNVQLNLLTDRILLDEMNNCNAGVESIALAPDGKFYVCPAFYLDGKEGFSVGDIESGLDIKNPQLYRLDHAPICRNCDAWQCRRCVWLNRRLTLEVNTPGREQCVMAHIERNASRKLLSEIRKRGLFITEKDIPEIDYLDPFEIINKH